MPVVLFTFHAYRSWSEANPRGYLQRGTSGVQSPNPKLAEHRHKIAKQPPTRFTGVLREAVLAAAEDACARRDWSIYAGSCTPTHAHLLVAWIDSKQSTRRVAGQMKRAIGFQLSRDTQGEPRKWFSRGWDATPICDQSHLHHLMENYLPQHEQQGGVVRVWRSTR